MMHRGERYTDISIYCCCSNIQTSQFQRIVICETSSILENSGNEFTEQYTDVIRICLAQSTQPSELD